MAGAPDQEERHRDRARWLAWQRSKPCPSWGWPILAIGALGLIAVGALLYGGSAARRGSLGDTLFIAVMLGLGMAGVVWLSHCRKALVTMALALAVGWASFVGGHIVGYCDAPNLAATYFDAHPEDLPAYAQRAPSMRFAAYVERATGWRGGSFLSYLRLQIAIGAETTRTMRVHGTVTYTVSGLGVLLMWLVQLLLLPLAAVVGTVAVTPGLNDDPPPDFEPS